MRKPTSDYSLVSLAVVVPVIAVLSALNGWLFMLALGILEYPLGFWKAWPAACLLNLTIGATGAATKSVKKGVAT